ncbi:MAG: cytochrome b [Sphingomonas sp.]|uniref:cytochrome b n=1 Tax=Sphingomonas sp. TaxID=28214 RepID=UPI00183FC322|nr:cytochrome b/b6 domain-containing protein [Sphingomonas sp.]MBA3666794.1 cytochrome b [Sphingomonas sp.]
MSDYMVEETTGDATVRYSRGAAWIHWITGILVLAQIYVGLRFADLPRGPARMELLTVHKTLGATILLAAGIRLAYRLFNPPPPYPAELPKWDRFAAVWSHRIVYVMLFALPLTGLIAVSERSKDGWVDLLWGMRIPALPIGDGEAFGEVHQILVWTTIALVVIHISAAIYHHLIARDAASGRLPPLPSTRRD